MVTFATDASGAAILRYVVDRDTSIVGMAGTDNFLVSTNPTLTWADFNNALVDPKSDELMLNYQGDLRLFGPLAFPLSADTEIFVAIPAASDIAQIFLEP